MKKPRTYRASVVTTFAAAALAGCSGGLTIEVDGGTGGSGGSGGNPPYIPPDAGQDVYISVNPPMACPAVQPRPGSMCQVEGAECRFGGECAGSGANCVQGRWQVWATNPPPAVCPSQLPVDGTSCGDPCVRNTLCTYEAPNCPSTKVSASCVGGRWSVEVPEDCWMEPTCPTVAPPSGSRCAPDGFSCGYDPYRCGSSTAYHTWAYCTNGAWQLGSMTCNPPPPWVDAGEPQPGEVDAGSSDQDF